MATAYSGPAPAQFTGLYVQWPEVPSYVKMNPGELKWMQDKQNAEITKLNVSEKRYAEKLLGKIVNTVDPKQKSRVPLDDTPLYGPVIFPGFPNELPGHVKLSDADRDFMSRITESGDIWEALSAGQRKWAKQLVDRLNRQPRKYTRLTARPRAGDPKRINPLNDKDIHSFRVIVQEWLANFHLLVHFTPHQVFKLQEVRRMLFGLDNITEEENAELHNEIYEISDDTIKQLKDLYELINSAKATQGSSSKVVILKQEQQRGEAAETRAQKRVEKKRTADDADLVLTTAEFNRMPPHAQLRALQKVFQPKKKAKDANGHAHEGPNGTEEPQDSADDIEYDPASLEDDVVTDA